MSDLEIPPKIQTTLLEDKARKILIAIVVVSIFLLVAIVIVSIVISFLRQEVDTPSLSFNVSDPTIWQNGNTICDPNNISTGHYRLNFYSGATSFAHTVIISTTNQPPIELARIIVPQESPATNLNYSYILEEPGTYDVYNFANNEMIGKFTFTYPNNCNTNIQPTM